MKFIIALMVATLTACSDPPPAMLTCTLDGKVTVQEKVAYWYVGSRNGVLEYGKHRRYKGTVYQLRPGESCSAYALTEEG